MIDAAMAFLATVAIAATLAGTIDLLTTLASRKGEMIFLLRRAVLRWRRARVERAVRSYLSAKRRAGGVWWG